MPGGKVTVAIPVDGAAGTIRVYLPAANGPVEIERLQFSAAAGKPKQWNFGR